MLFLSARHSSEISRLLAESWKWGSDLKILPKKFEQYNIVTV